MRKERRIDACLSTRNGRLFIEECDTVEIVTRFGSPVIVVSDSAI